MKIKYLLSVALPAIMLGSCEVHQFPEAKVQQQVTLRLHLDYSTELPLHKTVDYDQVSRSADRPALPAAPRENCDIRYTVNFYPYADTQADGATAAVTSRTHASVPSLTRVFTFPLSEPERTVDIDIDKGRYRAIVWTDYVAPGTTSHLHYNTDDFSAVTVHGDTHRGNTDFRDAFHGSADIDAGTWMPELNSIQQMPDRPVVEARISSVRPMAKFNILTTDLDEFISRTESSRAGRAGSSRSQAIKRSVELEDFTVVVRYPTYMPSVFNAFTGKPADSATGKSFTGGIHSNADGDVELGFDYVLVNGSEASVQVAVEVYDYDGTLLSSSPTMTLPLMRSRLTTVTGEFLTISAAGGVGISPGYDNDFNIIIK